MPRIAIETLDHGGRFHAYLARQRVLVFADAAHGTPSVGFGYRTELDAFALDVSFLNIQAGSTGVGMSDDVFAASWVKLEALHFVHATANATPYFGGGLSLGSATATTWASSCFRWAGERNGPRFAASWTTQGECS